MSMSLFLAITEKFLILKMSLTQFYQSISFSGLLTFNKIIPKICGTIKQIVLPTIIEVTTHRITKLFLHPGEEFIAGYLILTVRILIRGNV